MTELSDETRAVIDDLILRYLEPREWTFAANIAAGIELDVLDRLGEWPGPVFPNPTATVTGRLMALRNRVLVEHRASTTPGTELVAEWRKARG